MLFLFALLPVNPSKFPPETVLELCVAGSGEESAGWRVWAAALLQPRNTLQPCHTLQAFNTLQPCNTAAALQRDARSLPSSLLQHPVLLISPGVMKKALNRQLWNNTVTNTFLTAGGLCSERKFTSVILPWGNVNGDEIINTNEPLSNQHCPAAASRAEMTQVMKDCVNPKFHLLV